MKRVLVVLAWAVLSVSCGRSPGVLGSVAGEPVTLEEYLSAFTGLPPDRQVAVFEPGGRMDLMRALLTKRVLESASRDTPAQDAPFWEDLYGSAWLADSVMRSLMLSLDPEPILNEIGDAEYRVRVVLLEDSVRAREVASLWRRQGPSDPGGSLEAPWSGVPTSSYRELEGALWQLPPVFLSLLESGGTEPLVIPLHGAWLVGTAEGTGRVVERTQAAGYAIFAWEVERLAGVSVFAPLMARFARGEDLPPGGILSTWTDGNLTVARMEEILLRVTPGAFPDGVPPELSSFMPPTALDPVQSVWFTVLSCSKTFALADQARREGGRVPESTLAFARTEALIREKVLTPSLPDSTDVQNAYLGSLSRFILPERRSVYLGYSGDDPQSGGGSATSFQDLENVETLRDSLGRPIPTPLKTRDEFHPLLGERVFAAEPGVLQGPVDLGDGNAAVFQVIAWTSPDTLHLEMVYPLLEAELLHSRFDSRFQVFVDSLFAAYHVEIDTTAVLGVDPWAATLTP